MQIQQQLAQSTAQSASLLLRQSRRDETRLRAETHLHHQLSLSHSPFPTASRGKCQGRTHTRDFKARGDYIQRSFVRGFSVCKKA